MTLSYPRVDILSTLETETPSHRLGTHPFTMQESPFKSTLLDGYVALITGGGSGIGFEITKQLGCHGAKVVISGRRCQVLESACAELRELGIQASHVQVCINGIILSRQPMYASHECINVYMQGDVRVYSDCQKMVSEAVQTFGGLDIVVNCAAGNFLAASEQLSSNGFKTVMDIDALGTFNVSRSAFDALRVSPHASIINISATLHYGATWYQAHASAAKAAIDSLTRTLGLEWGSYGIRVNGVAPGPIQGTAGLKKLAPVGSDESTSSLESLWREKIPVGHPGKAWDIAMAVLYISGPGGAFVNGHTLVVDGGEWMYRTPILPRHMVLKASKAIESSSRTTGIAQKSKL